MDGWMDGWTWKEGKGRYLFLAEVVLHHVDERRVVLKGHARVAHNKNTRRLQLPHNLEREEREQR